MKRRRTADSLGLIVIGFGGRMRAGERGGEGLYARIWCFEAGRGFS